ncbi:MAG: nucleoside-diphosphate kinase, partial [bacterium]
MNNPKEEITYVMVKPDGVRKGLIGEIIRRFEQRDLKIVALQMHQPTKEEMNEHYPKDDAWVTRLGHKTIMTYEKYGYDPITELGTADEFEIGKSVRTWLIDYMVSAPVVKMVVQGIHAVDMVRKITGPTLPYLAEMGTIRGDYSVDSPLLANKEKRCVTNLVHASETPEEAAHEIEHWFGRDFSVHSY